jgi:hypothetical protein
MLDSTSGAPGTRQRPRRLGRGPVEVIVVAGILGFAAILVMMALPRGRETARMAACQNNLRQVGLGLQMYYQATGHLPTVPTLDGSPGDGPIRAMLDALVIPDLLDLRDPSNPPRPSQPPPKGMRVPGLACPSDPNAMAGGGAPVVSYRANTGDDPAGLGGPFQPGRTMTNARIEAADGLAYTAAFAERLVGDGLDLQPARWDYAKVPGLVSAAGCPDSPRDFWRGDAGFDLAEASWRSTLYNHALAPNADRSCIADDGQAALMGASSGHVNRVNVLLMDGSLRGVTPSIDPKVWRGLGTIETP